jgi:hypothetical protein
MKDVEVLRQKDKCYSPLKDIKLLQDLVMLHHLYRATTIFSNTNGWLFYKQLIFLNNRENYAVKQPLSNDETPSSLSCTIF